MGQIEDANLAIVQKFYEYIESGDREQSEIGFAELVSDDCALCEPEVLPYGGVHTPKPVMRAAMNALTEKYFQNFEYKVSNYLAGGDEVVVHLHIQGIGRETGKPFSMPVMELWRIRDGKAVEIRPFLFDAGALAAALEV